MLRHLSLLLSPLLILSTNPQSRDIRIINEAGFKVEIFWINRWKNDELVSNSPEGIFHGAESSVNSYVTHEFEVQEVPNKKLGKCKGPNDTCRKGYFQVNENDEQLVMVKEGLEKIEHTDNVSRARDQARAVLQECKDSAVSSFNSADPEASMNALLKCVDVSVNAAVEAKKDEISFQQNLRFEMGSRLGAYACVDPNVTMSTSIQNKTWSHAGTTHDVMVFFDRPASKITYVRNFISKKECDEVEASVSLADVDGINGLYARKGGVDIPFSDRTKDVTTVAERMYAYAADVMQIELHADAAEQMFMIHYPGNVDNPTRYDAHCDGLCDGSEHMKGERAATMIVYCETPEKGGHTHFNNAGIHIIPEKYSAVFFGYLDPTTNQRDGGFTQHTGCGVVEGNKKIVTHKIRV